jgi:hypothetical protein
MTTETSPFPRERARLVGCDDLRAWLQAQGFACAPNPVPDLDNLVNWYAFRRQAVTGPQAEQAEQAEQTVHVRPHRLQLGDRVLEIADVVVVFQLEDLSYELKAYSLSFDQLKQRLPAVSANLLAAWGAVRAAEQPVEEPEVRQVPEVLHEPAVDGRAQERRHG